MTLSDKTEEIFSLYLNYPLVLKKVTKMKVFNGTSGLKLLEAACQFYSKRGTESLCVPSRKYQTSKKIFFEVFWNITSFLEIFSFKKV